ncbi:uncharacterized protein G2W53_018299 [Senna tora]|uniref:Uncharacterized protein n=1 Tax=Senna tora TaxID=362788 RepID=A0A834WKY4_9FABA|nr:uncharacterized protein G2W53_018299 [Senna tora]
MDTKFAQNEYQTKDKQTDEGTSTLKEAGLRPGRDLAVAP